MKIQDPIPLTDLAQFLEAEIIGEPDVIVYGINEVHRVEQGDITFCDVPKYFKKAFRSMAAVVIVNERVLVPNEKSLLLCDDPFSAFNKLIRKFRNVAPLSAAISKSAHIHPSAIIEPNVVVGNNVNIGAYAHIKANVVIHDNCMIGERTIIHSGTTIGADAFYFKSRKDGFEKLETCGRVIIGDHVEIGACCTIDKGVTSDTIIGSGTKIDNQVHIGHGVIIGEECLIAAQVGIAGKCIIGRRVKLWGQVGVATRLKIGDEAEVYAQSGVSRDLEGGKAYFGSPAVVAQEWFSDYRAMKRTPYEILRILKILKK